MQVNYWYLIQRSVEEGIDRGWRLAHKHTEHPTEEQVKELIDREIMNSVSEWLTHDLPTP